MYKRKEVIEEEHLDWDDQTKDTIQEENAEVTLPSEVKPTEEKHKNVFLNKKSRLKAKSDIQHNIMTHFNGNEYLWLGLFILILPYIVGILFKAVLFFIYSGITLDKVFSIEKEYKVFELWAIGAYTFITISIIWILLKTYQESR